MLERVSILLPYKPDNGIRDKIFNWVIRYYEKVMPEVEVCVGKTMSAPFNRSEGINLAAAQATRDIFVIADSDFIFDPELIKTAIAMLDKRAWVIPYTKCMDLSKESTDRLLSLRPQWPLPQGLASKDRFAIRKVKPVGGIAVVPRKNFERVKGFDERFKGWGGEDGAFRFAMVTLCGPFARIKGGEIYHLWHPKVGPSRNPFHRQNKRLVSTYRYRRKSAWEMKKLIEERDKNI